MKSFHVVSPQGRDAHRGGETAFEGDKFGDPLNSYTVSVQLKRSFLMTWEGHFLYPHIQWIF